VRAEGRGRPSRKTRVRHQRRRAPAAASPSPSIQMKSINMSSLSAGFITWIRAALSPSSPRPPRRPRPRHHTASGPRSSRCLRIKRGLDAQVAARDPFFFISPSFSRASREPAAGILSAELLFLPLHISGRLKPRLLFQRISLIYFTCLWRLRGRDDDGDEGGDEGGDEEQQRVESRGSAFRAGEGKRFFRTFRQSCDPKQR
jgi:hypothetical protein